MARNSNWKDWIPASGEGRVLAEIKGKVGKGAKRMRRYSRKGPRNSRFWMVNDTGLMPTSPFNLSGTAPTLVMGITPTVDGTQTHLESQKFKLIGREGKIYFWENQRTATGQENLVTGDGSSFRMLFYIWRVEQITADGLQAQAVSAADPHLGVSSDLQNMLLTDRVLNWGVVPYNQPKLRLADRDGLATVAAGSHTYNPDFYFVEQLPRTIPLFRMPRMGITLGRDKAVVLRCRIIQWGAVAKDWINLADSNNLETFCQPMLRLRYTRA